MTEKLICDECEEETDKLINIESDISVCENCYSEMCLEFQSQQEEYLNEQK